jgi:hypothetical protein
MGIVNVLQSYGKGMARVWQNPTPKKDINY